MNVTVAWRSLLGLIWGFLAWVTATGSPRSSGRLRSPTDTKKQSMSMCIITVLWGALPGLH